MVILTLFLNHGLMVICFVVAVMLIWIFVLRLLLENSYFMETCSSWKLTFMETCSWQLVLFELISMETCSWKLIFMEARSFWKLFLHEKSMYLDLVWVKHDNKFDASVNAFDPLFFTRCPYRSVLLKKKKKACDNIQWEVFSIWSYN